MIGLCNLQRVLLFSLLILGIHGKMVVVVISQNNSYHVSRTDAKVQELKRELFAATGKQAVILATHELPLEGNAWTFIPLLENLATYKAEWFFFITERTQVNFLVLADALKAFDPSQELFLGHSLSDVQHAITHHYAAPHSLHYPHLPSGILLSAPALHRASEHVQDFRQSFNIDAQYELALFLKYHRLTMEVAGPSPPPSPHTSMLLTHLPHLCLSPPPFPIDRSCATVHREDIPDCHDGDEVTTLQVHFAVKTCSKFHSSRLPVVRDTWAGDAGVASTTYYSDEADPNYSTVYAGIPNTESGHCGKTVAIIKRFHELSLSFPLKWLVIADDDTLLSVPRLLRLLRCYDHSESILLGEAYGYGAHTAGGYTFITGGGGMVLSQRAVTDFVESGLDCPAANHPDDMYLGYVAKRLMWDVVHSSLFHQSQPPSFPEDVLKFQESISFHRHSPRDPLDIYYEYLQDHTPHDVVNRRTEL